MPCLPVYIEAETKRGHPYCDWESLETATTPYLRPYLIPLMASQ